MLLAFTPQGAFGFYAGLNLVALVMIFLWLPETKQRTLEEMDYIFAVPMRTHMKFQAGKMFPWWFRRYILRRKGEPAPQLYHFESDNTSQEVLTEKNGIHKDNSDEAVNKEIA